MLIRGFKELDLEVMIGALKEVDLIEDP